MPAFPRPHPRSGLAAWAVAAAAASGGGALVAAPAHAAETKTVSASIAYLDGSKGTVPVWKNIRVTIKLDERTIVDAQVLPLAARQSVFAAPRLRAVDLDDDGEGEVLIDVYTAGVECCRRTVVYRRSGSRYRAQLLEWQDTGYRLADVTGQSSPEFLTSDSRVPRRWDSDARGPIRVLQMRRGKVVDVSRRAPRQLRRDARIHRRAWRTVRRKGQGDARPIIAAYVIDLVRLGEIRAAKAALSDAARARELRTSRQAFARSLDRQLIRWGYSKRRVLSR